jgi:hypothetical protein
LPTQRRRLRRPILFGVLDTVISILLLALLVTPRAGLYDPAFVRGSMPRRASTSKMESMPEVFLWAWERPENLTFLDPRETGIAYLAETIFVSGKPTQSNNGADDVVARPRMQPLRVPDGTALIAVTRIEMRGESQVNVSDADTAGIHRRGAPGETHSDARAGQVAEAIARLAEIPGVRAVQVDFDATVSQRAFYSAVLRELRRRLPAEMPISITALASWCYGDAWLDSLPIDEAVPMLFRMGVDDGNIRAMLAQGEDFRSSACGASLGFSTDERVPVTTPSMLSGRRIYWFHPRPWNAAVLHDAAQGVRP